jgi:hypothetical protein
VGHLSSHNAAAELIIVTVFTSEFNPEDKSEKKACTNVSEKLSILCLQGGRLLYPENGGSRFLRNFIYISTKLQGVTQNYSVAGPCPSSGILKIIEDSFGNWICFRPQVREVTANLLGPLERANLSHWKLQGITSQKTAALA